MKRTLFLTVAIILFQSAFAISGPRLISNIRSNYAKMKTFEADFTQIQVWELAAEESRVSGKIYMKNDDSFRLETPGGFILSDGKTVWRYSEENAQVLIESIKENEDTMLPGKIFFDFTDKYFLKDHFERKQNGATVYFLELISPPDNPKFINRLRVKTDRNFTPFEIDYFDLDDNKTTFILENIVINGQVDNSKFIFQKPSEGVSIMDLR